MQVNTLFDLAKQYIIKNFLKEERLFQKHVARNETWSQFFFDYVTQVFPQDSLNDRLFNRFCVKKLDLTSSSGVSEAILPKKLDLTSWKVTWKSLQILSAKCVVHSLQLDMTCFEFGNEKQRDFITILKNLSPNLTELNLKHFAVSEEVWLNNLIFPVLESLALKDNALTGITFNKMLLGMPNIRYLDLENSRNLKGRNFVSIARLGLLEYLNVSGCSFSDGFKKIMDFCPKLANFACGSSLKFHQIVSYGKQLRELQMTEYEFSVSQTELLKVLEVEKLYLKNCIFPNGEEGFQPLHFFSRFPKLKKLSFSSLNTHMQQYDDPVFLLAWTTPLPSILPHLKALILRGDQQQTVSHSFNRDQEHKLEASFRSLEYLQIDNLDFSLNIPFPESLESLTIKNSNMTMSNFVGLLNTCKKLKSLKLIGGTASEETLKSLIKHFPDNLEEFYFDGTPAHDCQDTLQSSIRWQSLIQEKKPGMVLTILFNWSTECGMTQEYLC